MRWAVWLETAAILGLLFIFLLGIAFIAGGFVADSEGETQATRWIMIGVGFGLLALVVVLAVIMRRYWDDGRG